MGNICRSPLAEGVFRKLHLDEAPELRLQIGSAGTHAYHVGEPPDPRAMLAARLRGVDISGHRGQLVRREHFEACDYIVAMDHENVALLRKLQPAHGRAELKLLLEYTAGAPQDDVPDPYYGGPKDFERVLDLVEAGGRGLLAEILRRHRAIP